MNTFGGFVLKKLEYWQVMNHSNEGKCQMRFGQTNSLTGNSLIFFLQNKTLAKT